MTLILSGTNGLSDVDGTAATPAIRGTDANTGIFFPAADTIAFSEGGTEAMRIDSSGNLGLGVTPSAWYGNMKAMQFSDTASYISSYTSGTTTYQHMFLGNNGYMDASGNWLYSKSRPAAQYYQENNIHAWKIAASGTAGNTISFTQAMTLDASGNLLVGTTSGSYNTISSGSGYAFNVIQTTTNNSVVRFDAAYSSGTINYIAFYAAGTYRGAIQFNGTSVLYTTSSDYRLKEDIASMTGALAKVAALKPVTYKWKSTGEADQGFIAHELAEVCPQAVSGEKDAVNEDGSIKPQGIDTSFLVATLTAAIQELKALVDGQAVLIATQASTITALQADVEALKAQP